MNTRTKNAIRNIKFGLINKIILLLFPFFIRTTIIKTLGSEYVGLSSLFTSILLMLNLAELGISDAIIYCMYKPIAEKDEKVICALMNLFKKLYRIIGCIIFILGILLLPFLKHLIKGSYPANINIYLLYVLYLINTVLTYFLFAYKNALLIVKQRIDINSKIQSIISIIQYTIQIIVIRLFKNFYLYVIIQILCVCLNNIFTFIYTKKNYPKYICYGEVNETIKKDVKKRVKGLLIQKICGTTRNSLDSIFISLYLGLNLVAMYSNYYSIMYSIISIMSIITSSITAGIGNSVVTESEEKNYKDMNKINFIYMWLSGFCTICLLCLFQPFMKLWVGKEYIFPFSIVILFCVYFYSLKLGDIRSIYSTVNGLWYENRYRAVIESILNIILNIVLGKYFGVYGIILGTLISLLLINFVYGSQIVFKYYFKNQNISEYFYKHGLYSLATLINSIITYYLCSFVSFSGIKELILKGIICAFIPNIIYLIIYFKTKIFKESLSIIKK